MEEQQPQQRRNGVKPAENQQMAPAPPQKCPRCDSSNTKFCYYNNYSLSQPRYFCKACRRYWTHGGTLRNVPVGGGCRKAKRPKPSPSSEMARSQPPLPPSQHPIRPFPPHPIYSDGGSFLSSLAAMQSLSSPQFHDHYFPPRPSWTQTFINTPPSSTAAPTTDNHAASSFNPDHWQDTNQPFHPSSSH